MTIREICVEGRFRDFHAEADEPRRQLIGEIVRREGAAEKAGQRDPDLDGGQKPRGLSRQLVQPDRPLVAGGRELGKPVVVHGDDGNLGAREHGVDEDQHKLQDERPEHKVVRQWIISF